MQIDKQAHFFAGAAIAGLLTAYGVAPVTAMLIACGIGFAKELYDSFGYGTPDKWDYVVTMLGAATVLPIMVI